jgi:hypothetical protein
MTPRDLGLPHEIGGPGVELRHGFAIEGPAQDRKPMFLELLDLPRVELVYGQFQEVFLQFFVRFLTKR